MKSYEHRQFATTIVVILIIASAVCFITARLPHSGHTSLIVGCILLLSAVLFSSLKITIADGKLKWAFGLGLLSFQIPLTEIQSAEVTRTRFLEGWGIHLTMRGWLYNVSGYQAVLIKKKLGRQILLGTDQPDELCAAINNALKS